MKGFGWKCYHRLIHFPYDKGIFPKNAVTFYKLEQPLHPLPRDPIWTPFGYFWLVKCLILVVRNLKCLWRKKNCCLFERLFKVKKNVVFLFETSFFVLEIFTFLHYANEGSNDVIDRSTKTVQHSIKNISGNIKAVFLKLGTRNVHHKRNKMRAVMPLPWQQLCRWPCFN